MTGLSPLRTNYRPRGSDSQGSSLISQLAQEKSSESNVIQIPEISLPNVGSTIKGIDEKFIVNAVKGTNSTIIPLQIPPARSTFSPRISLSYGSDLSHISFELRWSQDEIASDASLLAGAQDMILSIDMTTQTNGKDAINTPGNFRS